MKHERIVAWAEDLTEDQLRQVVVNLTEHLIDTDDIHFYDSNLAPYWESCGEPIVFGQKVWDEE